MKTIGILGTGHVGAPMATYLAQRGHKVSVSKRNAEYSARLAATHENITVADNQGVVDAADIIIISLRPHIWRDAVDALTFRSGQQIISVIAGATLADLAQACTPVSDISITIPMAFVERGGCPLPVFPQAEPLQSLFAADNPVLSCTSERALNQHFAASSLMSAVLGILEEGANWLGQETGDRTSAEVYVHTLLAGLLSDMPQDGQGRLAEFKHGLATEGTLNLQMVQGLEQGGAIATLRATLAAIGKRMEAP